MTGPVVFDVNETLLDLSALDQVFAELVGDVWARREWFSETLFTAFALTAAGVYRDFSEVGAAALTMVGQRRGHHPDPAAQARVAQAMRELPPHPDVVPALDRLEEANVRIAALTNSSPRTAPAQLRHAGILERFERVLSVEQVGRFKPAPEVYRMAAVELAVEPGQMVMVAAHGWDVAGAMRAGCRGAFVARPGAFLNPLDPDPHIVGGDLTEVTEAILRDR